MTKNRFSSIKLIIFAIVSIFLLAGWRDTPEGIRQASESIQSVQAKFTQEKHLRILSSPLISKGHFFFRKPNSFRWEYTSPIQSILLMQNDKIRRYITSSGRLTEDAGVSLQGMQFVMQEITLWLRGNFDNPLFTAETAGASKIIMTPKEKSFAKMIYRIELTLSETPGIMESVVIYENETDYTKFTFSDAEVNVRIDDAVFEKIQ